MSIFTDGEQVSKEELLEVLSNREGAATASHTVARAGDSSEEEEGPLDPQFQQEFGDSCQEFVEETSGQEYAEEPGIGDMFNGEESEEDAVPAAAKRPGGIISSYRSNEAMQCSLAHQRTNKGLERLRHEHTAKVGAAQDAKTALDNEEQRLRALRKQAEANKLTDPARLSYQESEVNKAWDRLTQAEKARDAAELALYKAAPDGALAAEQAAQEQLEAKAIAREQQTREVYRARLARQKEDDQRVAAEQMEQDKLVNEQREEEEGLQHQLKGKERLRKAQALQKQRAEEAEQVREARFQHDANRILTLKQSQDVIVRQIQSHNERVRKKEEKVKLEREQRKKQLLDEGQNPYEVWRREEMQADKERQQQKLKMMNELRSEKLLEQLMVEERWYKRSLQEEKLNRQEAEEFQRQVGNYAREHKIASYIRKMTIGNVDVLDPTGTALRIDPSKVTIQKTHAFGLGRARAEEIQKVDAEVARGNKRIDKWKALRDDGSEVEAAKTLKPPKPKTMMRSASGDDNAFELEEEEEMQKEAESVTNESVWDEEELGPKKLWVPRLTKLEEQYMAAARERQKHNICSVQRCLGKEFKGDAFLAKPAIIAFTDFEVGKRYRQVIEVTNVSLTFNQFKLLPLDDKVKDFFEIEFVPPGRMSAGVTRYITLWFIPKMSQDIVSTFPILAKTGRIDFPLRCTTKKTILTVTPQDAAANPIIDFGQVLAGESAQRVLKVKNSGALGAVFTLEPLHEGDLDAENNFLSMISWRPEKSDFKEHGTTKISFNFTPTVLGNFSTELRLSINNGAPGDANFQEEKRVLVQGSCLDVPIYVEQEEYDLKMCIYGHTFRENVVVRNRQSVAMKIQVQASIVDGEKMPIMIEGEFQLNTTLAYIQGNKEQAIQVKFSPKDGFLDRYPRFRDTSRPGVPGAFRIPMRIVGADQILPVNTALVGTLTSSKLAFLPNILNFGRCTVGTSVACRLIVVNESKLKQRFAFLRLPSYLSIQDVPTDVLEEEAAEQLDSKDGGTIAVLDGGGDGSLGVILPGEQRQLIVTYSPEAATELDYKIAFKSITGELCVNDFEVACKGQGAAAALRFSNAQVSMASIPCDATSKESVVVTNTSKVAQMINVLVPPTKISGLLVSPICFTLEPQESKRIQLDFRPTKDYANLLKQVEEEETPEILEGQTPAAAPSPSGNPKNAAASAAAAAAAAETAALEAAKAKEKGNQISPEEYMRQRMAEIREYGGRRWEDPEANTVHCTWRLAIVHKPAGSQLEKRKESTGVTFYINVNTCVLPSVLSLDPQHLDFGEVTAGQRHILPVTITNLSPNEGLQELRMEALPENQCFTVLNAPRTVGAKPFQFLVEFKPQLVQIYQSTLQLRTQNTRVQVPLRGKGVRPVLRINPEDGILHMGSVVYSKNCKDYTTAKLDIKNESPFELPFKLETIIRADPNHSGVSPFTLTPSFGTVEANGSRTVTVTFRPHRPLALFREKVLVDVPNQRVPTFIYLYGHCFKYQCFAMYGMKFGTFGRSDTEKKAAFVDSLAVGSGSGFSAGKPFEYPQAQIKEFSLVFGHGERLKTLLIGASVAPGTPLSPQDKVPPATYDFQILPSEFSNLFTVEVPEGARAEKQAKGPLQPGKPALTVAFCYNPPEDTSLSVGGVSLDLLGGIGQWVTCKVRALLAGGYVPPPDAPNATQEITVELRAYLQQI